MESIVELVWFGEVLTGDLKGCLDERRKIGTRSRGVACRYLIDGGV